MSIIRLSRNRRHRRVAGGALATAALAAVAIAGTGASAADEQVITDPGVDQMATLLGTPDKGTKRPESPDLGTILASAEFTEASFEAAGVGLRNQSHGAITIAGVKGRPIKTFVYWADITTSTGSVPSSRLRITRTRPTPSSAPWPTTTVTGVPMGQGPSPCWGGDTLTVYRGTVTSSVANGNGTYIVQPSTRGSSIGGESPWQSVLTPPYHEGASLVMIYPGDKSVSVFDQAVDRAPALSGNMFWGTSNHVLERGIPSQGGAGLFAEIGAGGQTGEGHDGYSSGEVTRLNGEDIAGGNSGKGSDWDGDDGNPLPQLWDTHVHDMWDAPGTTQDKVQVVADRDCVTHIANVIAG